MGTRSLTFVYDSYKAKNGKTVNTPIINLYRQYDGYPTGHGAELAEFLAPFKVGNGLGRDNTNYANGMGCLAGQLVSHFKGNEAGQFYLYPTSTTDCGQDYEYHIFPQGDSFRIVVRDCGCNMFGLTLSDKYESIFDGSLDKFIEFCKEKETV